MERVYRLSKIGTRLPRRYRYGPAASPDRCQPGFEVFKGPVYSIANSIGPALGSLGEGDFTPAAGYSLMLLIDVSAYKGHPWVPGTWFVILPDDVIGVRSVEVAKLHSWLREQPECLAIDGQLRRDPVIEWATKNKAFAESWLEEHSRKEGIEFKETIERPVQTASSILTRS
jgi:hypothetical protein